MSFFSFCILVFSDRRVNPGSCLSPKPLPELPDLFVVYLQKYWPAAPSQDPGDRDTNRPFRLIYRAYSRPGAQGDRTVLTSLITRTTPLKSHLLREDCTSTDFGCYWNYNNNNGINNERYLCRVMHHDSSKAKHDIKKSKMAILFILFFSILFSPLLKKKQSKTTQAPSWWSQVKKKKTKWKTSGTASWWQAGQNGIVLVEERAIRHCLSAHSSSTPWASSPSVIPSQSLTPAQVGHFGNKGGGPKYGPLYPHYYGFPSFLDLGI